MNEFLAGINIPLCTTDTDKTVRNLDKNQKCSPVKITV